MKSEPDAYSIDNLKKEEKLFNTKEFIYNFETILKKLNTQANY